MENLIITKPIVTAVTKCQKPLTLNEDFKKKLLMRTKLLFVNREFIAFIERTIEELPQRDKLACLYYFKKLAVQVLRRPDPDHFKAFEDEYWEELSAIADEQKHYNPVKWIEAEIEYLQNTTPHLTKEDVNNQLDIMQEARQRLSKPWLTRQEVMQLFGFKKSTLNRRIAEGMPCEKHGRITSFHLDDINKWLKGETD